MTRPTDTSKRRKPPKPKHKRTCYKRRIRTKIAALRALNTCMESDDEARREKRIYFCNECHAWHLTSKDNLD